MFSGIYVCSFCAKTVWLSVWLTVKLRSSHGQLFHQLWVAKIFWQNSQNEQNRQHSILVYRWNVRKERESHDVVIDVSFIIIATIWKYNNMVNALSKFASKELVQTVKWIDRKHKEYVESKRPNNINVTNKLMRVLIIWIKILLLT